MSAILSLADFCQECNLPGLAAQDLVEALKRRETLELARHEARMARCAARPDNQALPLRDEGDDFGYVEARIPKTLFWNLMMRDGFGWEGLTSDDGIKDILKDNPQCRVKTVSGRIQTGWTPGRRTLKRYN